MRYIYLLFALFMVGKSYAEPARLSAGTYQLVCARDEGDPGEPELTLTRVQVVAKESKLYITIGDQTVEVRNDEVGAVLFTIPSSHIQGGPGLRGALVSQRVFVSNLNSSPARVEGVYRTVWPNGGDKGRFALIPEGEG